MLIAGQPIAVVLQHKHPSEHTITTCQRHTYGVPYVQTCVTAVRAALALPAMPLPASPTVPWQQACAACNCTCHTPSPAHPRAHIRQQHACTCTSCNAGAAAAGSIAGAPTSKAHGTSVSGWCTHAAWVQRTGVLRTSCAATRAQRCALGWQAGRRTASSRLRLVWNHGDSLICGMVMRCCGSRCSIALMRSWHSALTVRLRGKAKRPLRMLEAVLGKFLGSLGSVKGYHPTSMM